MLMFNIINQEKSMKQFIKLLPAFVLALITAMVFSLLVVRALREWAAPPPLPYGLISNAVEVIMELL